MSLGGLYGATQQQDREDFLRLKSVRLSVPTDEQLAKVRADYPDIPAHAQLVITWEPLSYRVMRGNEQQTEEVEFLRITKGSGLTGTFSPGSDEEKAVLEHVRTGGWAAIPETALIKVPKGNVTRRPFERWMKKAGSAGMHLDIGPDGQVFSKDEGTVFKVISGFDDFPVWNESKGRNGGWTNPDKGEEGKAQFMRYPAEKAGDYVQPGDVPTIHREARDGAGGEARTTVAAGGGVTKEQLRAAVEALGVTGQPVTALKGPKVIGLVNSKVADAPVLASQGVAAAAVNDELVEYFASQGVIDITDGTIALVG